MTPHEKLVTIRSYISDMSRLVNESKEEADTRIAFFGEDCDKIKVLSSLASKIVEITNRKTTEK